MPKFTSNGQLVHKGSIVGPDQELELTEEQAKRLGDKVTALKVEDKGPTVLELKKQAEAHGIDGFNNMKKDELIKSIEEKQKTEA